MSKNTSTKNTTQRNSSSKHKLQFRIYYKNNFKDVNQIALESQNNINAIQNLPASPTDFGLRDHYTFENFETNEESAAEQEEAAYIPKREIDYSILPQNQEIQQSSPKLLPMAPTFEKSARFKQERILQDHFQQVIDHTEQAFDECFSKFEKNVNVVMFGVNPAEVQMNNQRQTKFQSNNRPRTYQQNRTKKYQDFTQKCQAYNESKTGEAIEENSKDNKRPVTAITYHSKFQKQARSLSPAKNENCQESQPNKQNEIFQKWANFLNQSDKNIQKYEKIYFENSCLKKSPVNSNYTLPTAAEGTQNRFYQTNTTNWTQAKDSASNKQGIARSLSSRLSQQTQNKIQSQNEVVELHKMFNLLKKEMEQGLELFNIKLPFLGGKIMEMFSQNINFQHKEIIEDLNTVTQHYMYLLDKQLAVKVESFLDINTSSKKYLYREICDLQAEKLNQTLSEKNKNEKLNQQKQNELEKQVQKILNDMQKQKEDYCQQILQMKENYQKKYEELFEKHEKLKNENILLQDNVRQLKRDLIQQESDMKYYQIQSTNQFETKIRDLLEKYNNLENTSSKNDRYYTDQFECMNELVSNHQSAIVKLRLSKETIGQQAIKIEQLLNEIQRLNVRAATQFHDFTPRPSFTDLEDICKQIQYPQLQQQPEQKEQIQVIKFYDLDSSSRMKKISQIIKQAISEYQNVIAKLNLKNDLSLNQNKKQVKPSTRQSKLITVDQKTKSKSKQLSAFLPINEESKKKKSSKKNKFEQQLQKIQRDSIRQSELNISDNLSLNSEDKLALQKQSIDEYEDTFNDL
ncbi:hypothetical protein ABPG74_011044 [Tetrahymena malaccensis]